VAEYSIFIRPDLLQQFWQVMSEGGFITDAVEVIDTSRRTGRRVLVEAGGVRPRRGRGLKGRCLSFAEREEIALARAAGDSMRLIADRLGAARRRSPVSCSAMSIGAVVIGPPPRTRRLMSGPHGRGRASW